MAKLIDGLDYGPLTGLVGTWQGDKGMDVAPEPGDEIEENPYFETMTFTAIGDVTNAEEQLLTVIRYQQTVSRKSTGKVFHDQTGYWMWDARQRVVMHSLLIPRAVGLIAGGQFQGDESAAMVILDVKAGIHNPDWGIVQAPFMRDKAKTIAFRMRVEISENGLRYDETTVLDIYGKKFDHTDRNELIRVV